MQDNPEFYTDIGWRKSFSRYAEKADTVTNVRNGALRSEAIKIIEKYGAITAIEDPFGRAVWRVGSNWNLFSKKLRALKRLVSFVQKHQVIHRAGLILRSCSSLHRRVCLGLLLRCC
jgi:hypothetical protein